MSYLNDTLKRANIHSVTEYLMYGDKIDEKAESHEKLLDQAYQECIKLVRQYDNSGEESELFSAINSLITKHEKVYMEIGIKAGFRLAKEMQEEHIIGEHTLSKYKEMYMNLFNDISTLIRELEKAQRRIEEIFSSI